ncbi:MAG: phosphoadenylyl-sulfate reductase [Planctomycetes bacterium]|nr:phosphoadenylyl-sulfate reductase [Planctomycetota bacterium]
MCCTNTENTAASAKGRDDITRSPASQGSPQPADLETMSPEDILRYAISTHGNRAAIGTSFQKSGIVIIDMASRLGLPFRVFCIDTGLFHDETYALIEEVESRYGIKIERFKPDPEKVELMLRSVGQYAHFLARDLCCEIRKTEPMDRALATMDAWICGLRRDQSSYRANAASRMQFILDAANRPILKISPLLDWSADDVERYTKEHALPYNRLYDYVSPYGERYAEIGCRQCHIPVLPQLGKRAGKFPWEQGKKECGIHMERGGSGI